MFGNVSKTNGVKLLAAVAVLAMIVCAFAVTMPADETDAASGDTQSYSGNLTWNQGFPVGTNVVINDDLTISKGTAPEDATGDDLTYSGMVVTGNLTINEGVTVTIKDGGILSVNGGLVTINGEVQITGDGSTFTITGTGSASDYEKTGVVVNGTVDVIRGGTLAGEASASILVNNGATLSVSSSGSRISNFNGLNVDLATGGTFDYNGKSTAGITVTAYGDGDITSNAVVSINPGAQGGDEISDLTFTASSSRTTVYYTPVGESSVKSATMRVYTLNVSGTVDGNNSLGFKGTQTPDVAADDLFYSSEEAAERYAGAYYKDMVKFAHDVDDIVLPNVVVSDLKAGLNTTLWVGNASTPVMVTVDGNMNLAVKGNNDEQTSTSAILNVYGVIVLNGTMSVDGKVFTGVAQTEYGGIIVNGTLTVYNNTVQDLGVTGAGFIDDDDTRFVYGDLQQAIDAATAANVDEVNVYGGYKSSHIDFNGDGVQGYDGVNQGYGSFVIDTNVTVPADMTITIGRGVIVQEGVTLTFAADAIVEFEDTSRIWVEGKLVDYDNISTEEAKDHIDFEVMSSVDDGDNIINTYTSFVIALSETTSGTIYLYSDVEIDRNLTIPSGVTVEFSEDANAGAKIYFKADTDYTLTVDGTISISHGHNVDVSNGNLAVNNVVKSVDDSDTAITGNSGDHLIDGAYFAATLGDDTKDYYYITSVAFAAENSADIDAESGDNKITITGNVAMGDVTFTLGEGVDDLTVAISNTGTDRANGNVTLVGAITFDSSEGTFTGTVTDGTNTIEMDMSSGAIVGFDTEETVDSSIVRMTLGGDSDGIITINAGTVYAVNNASYEKIIIASGATMVVPEEVSVGFTSPYLEEILTYITGTDDDAAQREAIRTLFNALGIDNNLPLYTIERMETLSGLVVEGTLTVEGSVAAYVSTINGTVTTSGDASALYLLLSEINGAVTVDENSSAGFILAIVNGSMSGEFSAVDSLTNGSVAMIAYPGSDITGAVINDDNGDGASDLDSTTIYVNGDVYATMYAMQNINISSATLGIGLNGIPLKSILLFTDIPGYDENTAVFYMDEAMANPINNMSGSTVATAYSGLIDAMRNASGGLAALKAFVESLDGAYVGDYQNVYIEMDPSQITGTITTYDRLSVYIDGLSLENLREGNNYVLDVGQHTISVQIAPGYTGTYEITLNGQAITGNTFEITGDMKEFQIVVSGNITQESIVVDGGNSGSNDLGLTDYLLIILVILIVVMAIIVAMRLMRS